MIIQQEKFREQKHLDEVQTIIEKWIKSLD